MTLELKSSPVLQRQDHDLAGSVGIIWPPAELGVIFIGNYGLEVITLACQPLWTGKPAPGEGFKKRARRD
jgi:hypothetical protein